MSERSGDGMVIVKGPTKKYLVSAQTYFRDVKFLHALNLKMTRKGTSLAE